MKRVLAGMGLGVVITAGAVGAYVKFAQPADREPAAIKRTSWNADLLGRRASELEKIFLSGTATKIPLGKSQGHPLIDDAQGQTILDGNSHALNAFASLVWHGKTFFPSSEDPRYAWLENRILGMGALRANVHIGNMQHVLEIEEEHGPVAFRFFDIQQAKFDGRPSIILDYGNSTVPLVRGIRDEIRQIWPDRYQGLYLGRAWNNGELWVYFVLKFGN